MIGCIWHAMGVPKGMFCLKFTLCISSLCIVVYNFSMQTVKCFSPHRAIFSTHYRTETIENWSLSISVLAFLFHWCFPALVCWNVYPNNVSLYPRRRLFYQHSPVIIIKLAIVVIVFGSWIYDRDRIVSYTLLQGTVFYSLKKIDIYLMRNEPYRSATLVRYSLYSDNNFMFLLYESESISKMNFYNKIYSFRFFRKLFLFSFELFWK